MRNLKAMTVPVLIDDFGLVKNGMEISANKPPGNIKIQEIQKTMDKLKD